MINPGTRLWFEHSFEMLLATDLGQVSRVILVLPKANLNSCKWGNLGVTLDTTSSVAKPFIQEKILSSHRHMRTVVF